MGRASEERSEGFHVTIESGARVVSRGTDRAHGDAAGGKGNGRIL
jgi:hypothetical protein